MQSRNWNDLRYLLALRRHPKLAAAARALGVDATTVSRRLAALEATEGRRLHQRLADGRLDLTAHGTALARLAEALEQGLTGLDGAPGTDSLGSVRLTAVPAIANRLLAPKIGALAARHPGLALELIADARDRNLTRREADMALRFARPRSGGLKIVARRVATLTFAAYRARAAQAGDLPWIGYDEATAHLPQASWIEAQSQSEPSVRVADLETALEIVAGGYGRTLLPCAVADADSRLMREGTDLSDVTREVWLLAPVELAGLDRIRLVTRWVEEALAGG